MTSMVTCIMSLPELYYLSQDDLKEKFKKHHVFEVQRLQGCLKVY